MYKISYKYHILFLMCVLGGDLEESFLKLSNQKHTLLLYNSLLLVMIILLVFIMYVNNVISLVLLQW